jgi:hypothetical protein
MGARDRVPPDPAVSRRESPMEDRRRRLPEPVTLARSMGTQLRQIIILTQIGILGPPPLFRSRPHAGDRPRPSKVASGDTKRRSRSPETPHTPGPRRSREPDLHRQPSRARRRGPRATTHSREAPPTHSPPPTAAKHLLQKIILPNHLRRLTNSPNLIQPGTLDTLINT